MNNQSPLVPQGSLIEQKNQGRARVKIAVFFVLAIHGIGLVALLMQGCQKEKEPSPAPGPTNAVLPVLEPTNIVAEIPPVPAPPTNYVPPPPLETNKNETPPAGATEYKVVKNDNFTTIAHHFKISVKALAEANPGVDSSKLKVDQTLHIPAPPAAAPTGTGTTVGLGSGTDAANGEVYTVESGDNLTNIAKKKNTTVKALRAANSLKTDQLKVGQKLKIPKAAPAATPTAPVAK